MIHSAADDSPSLTLRLPDEAATLACGAALAQAAQPGLHIHLLGDLGAGKTTLVRGLLRALGYTGPVKSPTFTLVELYATSRLDLHHFDFYRFASPEEYLDAGLQEYFGGSAVCLVEWPDKAEPYLGEPDLRLHLRHEGDARTAEIEACTAAGRTCLERLRNTVRT